MRYRVRSHQDPALIKQESGDTGSYSKVASSEAGLTIPRLELVAGHMTTKLVSNVAKAIGEEKVSQLHVWIDIKVAIYWIQGMGQYNGNL